MKKGVFLLLILIIQPVLAINIELSKPAYSPYETLQATISGDFLVNLKPENIFFYSGKKQVSMVYDLARINETY